MKKRLSIFLILNLVLLTITLKSNVYADESQFQPIVVTGFNEDLIADNTDGNSASTSTTKSFDAVTWGANNVMYSVDFRGPLNPSTAPTYGLPINRVIDSSQNPGVSYTLEPYDNNNALLLIDQDDSGTLTLETSGAYEKIIVLASSASGDSEFDVTLNFSDGTNFNTSFIAPDWYNGNGYAIKGIGRVSRTNEYDLDGSFSGDDDNPRLYDCFIDNTLQKTKLLTSISFKKTSITGRTAILAVAGQKSAGAPTTPVTSSASNIVGTSFEANWEAVAGATSYYLDVATNSSFTQLVTGYNNLDTGDITSYHVTGLDNNSTYYYRVRAVNANGVSFSSSNTSVTTLSDDATIVSVLSQNITAGSEAGTSEDPITASISVANNISSLAEADIVKHDTGATVNFYGTDSSFSTIEIGSVNLTAGIGNPVYIKIVAEDNTAIYYKVTITRASANSNGESSAGGNSNEESSTPITPSNQDPVIVIVNGKVENAGTETKTSEAGKTIVTVEVKNTVIDSKIEEAIKNNPAGINNHVQIPVADKTSDVVKIGLTGDIVKKLEDNAFDISIKRDTVEYLIPAEELTIKNVAKELGVSEQALKDIKIEVQITKLDASITSKYNEVAKANGAEFVFSPVAFEVVAKTTKLDGTIGEVEISKFNSYVERVMEIPSGVDPSKITTGIVFNPDGTYSHVPTVVFQKDDKWYAKLNSLTNSAYSVIWNPVTVKSVEKHWSKDAVNDMASRLVVFNVDTFSPDKAITRADFAEYIVRALGLYREGSKHENKFADVSAIGDRTLAILIASEYGIVTGYPDGTFRPDALITREEAMTMYQRAMMITKLVGTDNNRYKRYTDYKQVGNWATSYVQAVLSAHVFNGTTETTVSPKSNLTYAEAVQAIRNLLLESELINK